MAWREVGGGWGGGGRGGFREGGQQERWGIGFRSGASVCTVKLKYLERNDPSLILAAEKVPTLEDRIGDKVEGAHRREVLFLVGRASTCLRMRDMRPLSPDSLVAPLLSLSISQKALTCGEH